MLKSIDKRREKVIRKLLAFNVVGKEDDMLQTGTLFELEITWNRFERTMHPHGGYGGLQIKW
ncbi:MAG TPA: Fur-regulated basic protein FbpA [Pseudogracilibacillus sp.]|nr:Fur-regulated basic protein FbpA [Pseudogracilibacillus sp.]